MLRNCTLVLIALITCSALASCARSVERAGEEQAEAALTAPSKSESSDDDPSPSELPANCVDCLGFKCAFLPYGGTSCYTSRTTIDCVTTGDCRSDGAL